MKQSHWLLCLAKNCDCAPENHATVKLDWNCFSWNELTEKAELNCEIDNS